MTRLSIVLLLLFSGTACGSAGQIDGGPRDTVGDVSSPGDAGANDLAMEHPSSDGEVDRASDLAFDAPPADAVPADGPAAACGAIGTACSPENASCSSGDPIEIACRDIRICHGHWQGVQSQLGACQAGGPNACPMAPPTADTACVAHGQLCSYPDGTSCGCMSGCESGADAGPCNRPYTWACRVTSHGCPLRAPQLGDPCDGQAIACSYGLACDNYEVQCQDHHWQLPPYSTIGGCA